MIDNKEILTELTRAIIPIISGFCRIRHARINNSEIYIKYGQGVQKGFIWITLCNNILSFGFNSTKMDLADPDQFTIDKVKTIVKSHLQNFYKIECKTGVGEGLKTILQHRMYKTPVMVRIIPINDGFMDYALELKNALNISNNIDTSYNTAGFRIRLAEKQKVPYIIVLGKREKENREVNIRTWNKGDIGNMSISKFIEMSKND